MKLGGGGRGWRWERERRRGEGRQGLLRRELKLPVPDPGEGRGAEDPLLIVSALTLSFLTAHFSLIGREGEGRRGGREGDEGWGCRVVEV